MDSIFNKLGPSGEAHEYQRVKPEFGSSQLNWHVNAVSNGAENSALQIGAWQDCGVACTTAAAAATTQRLVAANWHANAAASSNVATTTTLQNVTWAAMDQNYQVPDLGRQVTIETSEFEDHIVIVDDEEPRVYSNLISVSSDSDIEKYQVQRTSPGIRRPLRRDKSEIGKTHNCLVCSSTTSRFHFGATVCDACGAFFRRTISEHREYVCRVEGEMHLKCEILCEQRCYCRACRLHRCLMAGMDPAAVQPHRDQIGGKKSKSRKRQRHSNSDTEQFDNNRIRAVISGQMAPSSNQKSPDSPPSIGSPGVIFVEELECDQKDQIQFIQSESSQPRDVSSGGVEVQFYSSDDRAGSSRADLPKHRVNFEALTTTDDTNPGENMVETMLSAYSKLWERRRLMYCPGTMRDILGGTQPVSRPADLGARMQKSRLRQEVGLVAEFINSLSPFTALDLDDRVALFRALACKYSVLEKHYVTMKNGGLQMNRIIHNDYSFTDLSDSAIDQVRFEDGKSEPFADKATLKKIFIDPLREALQTVTGAMYNMKMTDVEFCGLIAVMLFDSGVSGLSDASRTKVLAARNRVYTDWFKFYRANNTPDPSERLGSTMLLLPAIQATVAKAHENYHMVRVFDLFEYDKILDEMMTLS